MDALALLCHLSADGTSTLTRLRYAGYESLQDVLLADDEDLGEVLDAEPPVVRRLRRQAESLEDRMGEAAAHDPEAPSPALVKPEEPRPVRPAMRPTPLLCKLETEPLPAEEDPAAFDDDVPAEEPATRSWTAVARDDEDGERPDPGPSGPFA